jgi:hypothetical protein
MRILNPNRYSFVVEAGDKLLYNQNAVDFVNSKRQNKSIGSWPPASELNKKNPVVLLYKPYTSQNGEKLIELRVRHDGNYTGLSGIVEGIDTDIWCLLSNGNIWENCNSPLFKKR